MKGHHWREAFVEPQCGLDSIEFDRRHLISVQVLARAPSHIAEIAKSGLVLENRKIVSDLKRLSPEIQISALLTQGCR